MNNDKNTLLSLILLLCSATSFAQNQLAFPTAEGYGKYTAGGRGGKVLEVTNLSASGKGSLRAALEAKGPRTVVFRVSGTIDADLKISNDFITIAGQSAPGDGIAIRGTLGISANNVIIRYIRVRAEGRGDAVSGRYNKNLIFDHVSASWSSDEVFSIYHGEYVTIQWCMITEACSGGHKFGGIWGNNHSTYHHNLFAHNTDRNPRIASGGGYNDIRNNVIYNWKNESTYGAEMHQKGDRRKPPLEFSHVNLVANYYKPGPGTPAKNLTRICSPWSRNGAADYGKWYLADNYLVRSPEVTADNWKGVFPQYTGHITLDFDAIPGLKLDKPSVFMPINQQSAEEAYQAVLKYAGCSLPNRDALDARIIEEVRTGTATKGDKGFVKNPMISGGWPELKSLPAPADSDHDGMPDAWEKDKGLNPNDAADGNKVASDGYTMLEKYLNSIR
jgi:pectate lyase